ncbi:MAG: hypothetical protein DME37_02265 [Verrucomicrobia bacterium]|nr:MAG: hypothetical protein DME37_02265 [Verrucomicrobiota bacterium]
MADEQFRQLVIGTRALGLCAQRVFNPLLQQPTAYGTVSGVQLRWAHRLKVCVPSHEMTLKKKYARNVWHFSVFGMFRGPNFLLQFLGFLASLSVFGR